MDMNHYCEHGRTHAEEMVHQLQKLEQYHAKLMVEMRDLSPAALYARLERTHQVVQYTCGEVAHVAIQLEKGEGTDV